MNVNSGSLQGLLNRKNIYSNNSETYNSNNNMATGREIVEVPVYIIREVEVEKIVEKEVLRIIEVPVENIVEVEKIVYVEVPLKEVLVEIPVQVEAIKEVEVIKEV